ncbi:MAG: type I secretion C-terminal target domain-containing protein, partial [Alphaproteobacteria bacterium]|nr:type I secretion C-terminal target domain-containing protein [Alphaproteobacteria bacterium]
AGTDGGLTLITSPGSYNLSFGRLTLNSNGSYTYVRYGDNGGTDRFNYTIRDRDGDTDTATLTLTTSRIWSGDGGDGGDGDGGGDGFGDGCPLVIDLDGDGIELISREDGVLFDIDEDGIADQTAWVGADDGILVLDHNDDGVINDHSEMFGNDEIGGFEMLSDYDSNNDGVIDANDQAWSLLQVWQDVNGDAYSQADELFTLDQLGIQSISLDVTDVDLEIAGNDVTAVSDVTLEDGTILNAYDAWFSYERGSYGTDGEQDTFLFQAIAESAVTLNDFNAQEGDVIDLSLLIEGTDDVTEAINDYVHATEVDGATVISVDVDGAGGPAESVEVARLEGVTGTSIQELIESGNLTVD